MLSRPKHKAPGVLSMPTSIPNHIPQTTCDVNGFDLKGREFFAIIGAMKAGTTSLARYLGRHPRIFMAARKEPKFFSRDEFYLHGIEWYAQLFAGASSDQILGEASTCYSRRAKYPHAAERLHKHLPQARLLYVLRHPVDRLYSHYVYCMQPLLELDQGRRVLGFEEFVRQDEEALDAGDYVAQIEQYLPRFGDTRLKCLLYDDLFGASSSTVNDLFTFLGVGYAEIGDLSQVHENKRGSGFAKHQITDMLTKIRQSFPAKRMVDIVPRHLRPSLRRAALRFLSNSPYGRRHAMQYVESLPKLSPTSRSALCRHYRPSVLKLEEFIGRPLRHWLE